MTLIRYDVRGVTITAEKVGDNFVVHPSILRDEDTGEFHLSADTWDLGHLPSSKQMLQLHQEDPVEYPGHPIALDLDIVRAFVKWFESRLDCSVEKPALGELSADDFTIFTSFRLDPAYWQAPEVNA